MENDDRRTLFNQPESVVIAIIAAVILIGVQLVSGITSRMSDGMIAIMIISIISSLIGFVIWTLSNSKTQRARIQAQSDLLNRMLDRFDSPEAMITFLESSVGQQTFGAIASDGSKGEKRLKEAVASFYNDDE